MRLCLVVAGALERAIEIDDPNAVVSRSVLLKTATIHLNVALHYLLVENFIAEDWIVGAIVYNTNIAPKKKKKNFIYLDLYPNTI